LELRIEFERGARFSCPECDRPGCPVHDSTEKTWRHLDFFQHQAFLTAKVPRVVCPEHGVRRVAVPWARPGSRFTLLFEALVMALVAEMPVNAVAGLIAEHDKRVWWILHHYVDRAHATQDVSLVSRLGVDETSSRHGQDYVSVFADLDGLGAIYATPGRGADTYERFVADLKARGGRAGQIAEVCQDMSERFLTGALEHLPDAEITFDRYHVKAQLTRRRSGPARRGAGAP
jgi:transposase